MQNFNELNYFLTLAQNAEFCESGTAFGDFFFGIEPQHEKFRNAAEPASVQPHYTQCVADRGRATTFRPTFPTLSSHKPRSRCIKDFLNTPSGLIRINAPAVAAEAVLYPKLKPILNQYPKR